MSFRNWVGSLALCGVFGSVYAQDALYETSFENFGNADAVIKEFADGETVWYGKSPVKVTKSKRSGNGLVIVGGPEQTLEVRFDGGARNARGVSFYAERWTSTPPFACKFSALINDEWQEIIDLSRSIVLESHGASKNPVVIKFPEAVTEVKGIKITIETPPDKGIIIDDFKLLSATPENTTVEPTIATEPIAKILHAEVLFKPGMYDSKSYRIPAMVTAPNGDVIVTIDVRREHAADLNAARKIDIGIRRSSDNGDTWSEMELIAALGDGKPASDPSLVVDNKTGEIFCFYNFMDRDKANGEYRFYVQSSKDNGKTWSAPRDFTDEVVNEALGPKAFKFITAGRGFCTQDGKLLHIITHVNARGCYVFGSEDHGATWKLMSDLVTPADESKIIELNDGTWMINSRVNGGPGCRWVHRSTDQGATWTTTKETQLIDPSCNAAIIRHAITKDDGTTENILIFSNANWPNGRKNMAIKVSRDNGATWSAGKVIDEGGAMYSDLTILSDGTLGLVYEAGQGEIRFVRIALEELL